ncbi:hypothetical protein BP6252_10748 [Coleophoma cylindrospora]|uniref:Uncharacterized protein n=1 Tax=Coleophoma cylindrospora TaxID=1849047 RepID=A0A3D8QTJ5_9HELO|nr:hypothetical protein BP6252_10748 [Coleophoma cylindrospora]
MSLTITAGVKSLLSVGISLGDIAIIIDQGRKFGNWLRTARLDEELFEAIADVSKSILDRPGLVDVVYMSSKWSYVNFIYKGNNINNSDREPLKDTQNLTEFSWAMVAIIAGLDVCLPSSSVQNFLVDLFVGILNQNEELAEALRVQLPTNIESWRSAGQVRDMARVSSVYIQKCRLKLTQERAIPELNQAERGELQAFLKWLLIGKDTQFHLLSATVFAIAGWLKRAGLHLNTEGDQRYETEPMVRYASDSPLYLGSLSSKCHPSDLEDPLYAGRGLRGISQQVTFPRGKPELMIDTLAVDRDITNSMFMFWELGCRAATKMELISSSLGEYDTSSSDIHYTLEDHDPVMSKFAPNLSMLACHGFPVVTQSILNALEKMIPREMDPKRAEWLQMHTAPEFLSRLRTKPSQEPENMGLWTQYQALVFGFYYKLLEPLISFEHVHEEAYFRGIWGYGSKLFLVMCSQFAEGLRRDGSVSRTHLLYMLSTMYNGRQHVYSKSSSKSGLVGIIGPISVLTLPLLRVSDIPRELGSFMLVDLPVIDLLTEANGELYSGHGTGLEFFRSAKTPEEISPHAPDKPWSVHAKMGNLFDGQPGVVMAARCGGSLVGYFSPLAADITFLGASYHVPRHESGYVDDFKVHGYEIKDEDWQCGRVQRPSPQELLDQIGVVHSRGCPALRYAAAGFFAGVHEEVAIVTDDIEMAVGRVSAQDGGVIIT